MEFTPRSLTQRAIDLDLATPEQIDQIWGELRSNDVQLEEVKNMLLRKSVLTNFQLDRMCTGERLGFFYGRYRVLYMIGAGTFARVFRCVHRDTGRVVAVKVLRRRHRDQVASVEQFLREGRMGLQLRHPNIVTIFEIENDARSPYLVMEFVEGETLREILKIRKSFGAVDALNMMQGICSGLDFAASKGITHRDLKLTNVLVHSSGRCKLVDFGLAAMADVSTPEAIADCPSARAIDYAALERGTGVRKGDPRSDLFFVGIIFYNIVCGKPAMVETRDRLQRLSVSRFTDITPLNEMISGLPDQIYAICNKALEFDPEKRYQTPGAVLADLQAAIRFIENPDGESREKKSPQHAVQTINEDEAKEGNGKTLIVVESKPELQDILREKLKKRGYRVLIYGDPERALNKFTEGETPADCVVLCAPDLGNLALEAFNKFTEQEHTKSVPVVMLVDPKQQHIIRGARTSPSHVLIPLPLKVRELRQALVKLTKHS